MFVVSLTACFFGLVRWCIGPPVITLLSTDPLTGDAIAETTLKRSWNGQLREFRTVKFYPGGKKAFEEQGKIRHFYLPDGTEVTEREFYYDVDNDERAPPAPKLRSLRPVSTDIRTLWFLRSRGQSEN